MDKRSGGSLLKFVVPSIIAFFSLCLNCYQAYVANQKEKAEIPVLSIKETNLATLGLPDYFLNGLSKYPIAIRVSNIGKTKAEDITLKYELDRQIIEDPTIISSEEEESYRIRDGTGKNFSRFILDVDSIRKGGYLNIILYTASQAKITKQDPIAGKGILLNEDNSRASQPESNIVLTLGNEIIFVAIILMVLLFVICILYMFYANHEERRP